MKKFLLLTSLLSIILCSCSNISSPNKNVEEGKVSIIITSDKNNLRQALPNDYKDYTEVGSWNVTFTGTSDSLTNFERTETITSTSSDDFILPIGTYTISVSGQTGSIYYIGSKDNVLISTAESTTASISVETKKDDKGSLKYTLSFDSSKINTGNINISFTELITNTAFTSDLLSATLGITTTETSDSITLESESIPSGFYEIKVSYIDGSNQINIVLDDPYIEICDGCKTEVTKNLVNYETAKNYYATKEESSYNGTNKNFPINIDSLMEKLSGDDRANVFNIYFDKTEDLTSINFNDDAYLIYGKRINLYWDGIKFCSNGTYIDTTYVSATGIIQDGDNTYEAFTCIDTALNYIGYTQYITEDTVFNIYTSTTSGNSQIELTKTVAGDLSFSVSSAAALKVVSELSNENVNAKFEDCLINITGDITISEASEWTPISSANGTCFRGTLNGNGHTINVPMIEFKNGEYGFAGIAGVNEGTITNIIFTASDAATTYSCEGTKGGSGERGDNVWTGHVGGIAAINKGYIKNCWNKVSFSTPFLRAGGIAGWNMGTIENCLNTGNIYVYNSSKNQPRAGGIAGAMNVAASANILNCVNYGNVGLKEDYTASGTGAVLGSICGGVYYDSNYSVTHTFMNCYYKENTVASVYTEGTTDSVIVTKELAEGDSFVMTSCGSFGDELTLSGSIYITKKSSPDNIDTREIESITQELQYGTDLEDALNAYVSANSSNGLASWTTVDSKVVLNF